VVAAVGVGDAVAAGGYALEPVFVAGLKKYQGDMKNGTNYLIGL